MDPHFLLDIFTLCSVASLVVILILTKALKRRRLALSHQTKSTQTENPVLNLDESINRLSTEMLTLQDRLDHLEQERLEQGSLKVPKMFLQKSDKSQIFY